MRFSLFFVLFFILCLSAAAFGDFRVVGEPINISGGLKSFGHPPGASGGREVMEFYLQFQGRAQEPSRQLKDVKLGLAHNQGGNPGLFICGITIVGAPA